jgi:hypothetical protein
LQSATGKLKVKNIKSFHQTSSYVLFQVPSYILEVEVTAASVPNAPIFHQSASVSVALLPSESDAIESNAVVQSPIFIDGSGLSYMHGTSSYIPTSINGGDGDPWDTISSIENDAYAISDSLFSQRWIREVPIISPSANKRVINEENGKRIETYLEAVKRHVFENNVDRKDDSVSLPRKYLCRLPVSDRDISKGEISIGLHVPSQNPGNYTDLRHGEFTSVPSGIGSSKLTSSTTTELKCIGEFVGMKISKLLRNPSSLSSPNVSNHESVIPFNETFESRISLGLERHSLK